MTSAQEAQPGNRFVWLALLVFFGGLNIWALAVDGLVGIPSAMVAGNAWNKVIIADTGIALLVAMVWMFDHARRQGTSAVPYLLLTMATGSFGLLIYLVRNAWLSKKGMPVSSEVRMRET